MDRVEKEGNKQTKKHEMGLRKKNVNLELGYSINIQRLAM